MTHIAVWCGNYPRRPKEIRTIPVMSKIAPITIKSRVVPPVAGSSLLISGEVVVVVTAGARVDVVTAGARVDVVPCRTARTAAAVTAGAKISGAVTTKSDNDHFIRDLLMGKIFVIHAGHKR